jgi:uncharacterized protein (DUF3084 family)
MEKILNLILEKITGLETGQHSLVEGQRKLETGQHSLVEGQRKLEAGQSRLEAGQRKLEERQDKLENNQHEMALQIRELDRKVGVIYEQTAGLLEFKTETLQFQARIEEKVNEHDMDIRLLKKMVAK